MSAAAISDAWVAEHLPSRPDRAHKGTFGRVLAVAGSIDYPGAALLTALGAMRAGAGVVRVAAAESVVARLAGSVPEVTWMSLDEEAPGLIAPGGWRRVTAEASGYDAVVVGPGLGRQPATLRRTRRFVAALSVPTVVDADGLNALSEGARWWHGLRASLVVTPHPIEFARLTGADPPGGADDEARAAAAGDAAATWGQTVVLKGAHSVVAGADGTVLRCDVATPALATAGSGDVLAGAIGALLAGGVGPFAAATCGVAIHAESGRMVEERIGRAGAMATDIAGHLPEAMERLRGHRSR